MRGYVCGVENSRTSAVESACAKSTDLTGASGLFDDLKVVPNEAERELEAIVEGTQEGFARGLTQRPLERLKGVACGF